MGSDSFFSCTISQVTDMTKLSISTHSFHPWKALKLSCTFYAIASHSAKSTICLKPFHQTLSLPTFHPLTHQFVPPWLIFSMVQFQTKPGSRPPYSLPFSFGGLGLSSASRSAVFSPAVWGLHTSSPTSWTMHCLLPLHFQVKSPAAPSCLTFYSRTKPCLMRPLPRPLSTLHWTNCHFRSHCPTRI